MDLMQLTATLGLDASGFEAGVNKSRGIFGGLSGTISAGTVALGSLMADVVRKGADMVVDLGKTALDYNMQMEDYTANFRVMLGSTEAAAAKVEALKEFAAKTPFEMTDLAGATQTLLAFGIEAERTDGIMQMLGDVSLGNSQKFASLATVFGQVSSSGKLLGQDLMQFINQGFNPLQVIAEKTGASMGDLKNVMSGQKTSKDFQKMVRDAQKEVRKLGDGASDSAKLLAQIGEDGMISAEMVEEAFRIATEEGGQFYKGMEESSKTLSGLMSTLSDNWTALVGDVFKPVSDFLQTTLIPLAIGAVETLQKAFDEGGFSKMAQAAGDMVGSFAMGIVSAAPIKMIAAADAIIDALNARFDTNIPTIKDILVNPPTWEELSAQMSAWWEGISASMRSLMAWTLGEFIEPTAQTLTEQMTAWWETAKNSVSSVLTWALGAFKPPAVGDISQTIGTWWIDTARPAIVGALTWTLGQFSNPNESELLTTIADWWNTARETITGALVWALGAFEPPDVGGIIGTVSTWWSETAWPMISTYLTWGMGEFTKPNAESIALIIGTLWSEQVRPLLDNLLGWTLGTFTLPNIAQALLDMGAWWRESGRQSVVDALDWTLGEFVLPTLTELGDTIMTWAGMLLAYVEEQLNWTLGLLGLPTISDLSETVAAWADELLAFIEEKLAWGLGELGLPSPGEIITQIATWWDGLVQSVNDILVGAFGITLPDPAKIVADIKAWWQGVLDNIGELVLNVGLSILGVSQNSVADKIKKDFGGGSSTGNGAGRPFAVGLDYVPYDDFPARLHRGEAVLTRTEAEDWRAGEGGRAATTIVVNQYINSEAQTAADLMREARWEQERGVLMAGV